MSKKKNEMTWGAFLKIIVAFGSGIGGAYSFFTATEILVHKSECKEHVGRLPGCIELSELRNDDTEALFTEHNKTIKLYTSTSSGADKQMFEAWEQDVWVAQLEILKEVMERKDVQAVYDDVYKQLTDNYPQESE